MNRAFLALPVAIVVGCAADAPPPPVAPPPPTPSVPVSTPPATPVAAATNGPPVAPVRPVTDTYFGTPVVDPYRWMEDPKSTEVAAWMKGQADYTRSFLDALPERKALLARITELDHTGVRVSDPQEWGGHWFYLKREPGHELPKLCVRDSLAGSERVLVDVEAMQKGDAHFAIDWSVPSRDGKLVAVGVSQSGSESSVLSIIDTATGKSLPDTWDRMQFGGVSWIDAKHFTYTRLQKVAPDAPQTEKYKRATSYLHELGRDPEKDPPVLGAGVAESVPFKDTEIGIVINPVGTTWALGLAADGVRNELRLYVAPQARLGKPKTPWTSVVEQKDEVTQADVRGGDLFLLSHHGALRFQVLKTGLAKPDVAKAEIVVPEGSGVVRWLSAAKDGLYFGTLDGGIDKLHRLPYAPKAKVDDIVLPVDGSVDSQFARADRDGIAFRIDGWTASPLIDMYDAKTKKIVDTKLLPRSPIDFSGVVSEEVKAKSADGTAVPLSILHAKTFDKNGAHPTWLSGYGSYGISIDPGFSPTRLAWIEHDGVLAYCHARGGGELGEGWHKDGMLLNKHHTVEDMIGCAQWLVDNNYTAPSKLAGEGTSAGGITIGGAITQRPDLFGAALIRVGVSNALRFENTENVLNIPEFGSVETEDGFKGLLAMDAYGHVKDGTPYPAVLVTTGATDPRVAPWQADKMAARLQAATSSGKPVLLRVDYDAGHGLGSTAAQRDAELADEEAFLLSQLH